jgi:tripartite-type tricarboxylate transporter receptor subunit TctC
MKHMNSRKQACGLLACLGVVSGLLPVARPSAAEFPSKPVRFVVPYAPGGSSDVIARLIGQKLGESLGQTFVVDNRPGAGSMIGTDVVAKSLPDGYTILLSDMPHTINPSVYASVPYDPIRDFSPVTVVGASPLFLFVHPAQPATLREFITAAKAQPSKLAFGSGGNGTASHLMGELFQIGAGVKLTHVPYKGAGPAMGDVVAGQIPSTFTSMATAAPHVQGGRVRTLAVTSAKRLAALPNVPTFDESGVSGMVISHWWAVMAPAGVPKPVVEKLRGAIVQALASRDLRERYAVLSVDPVTSAPDDLRKLLETDVARWRGIVKSAGIKLQ